MVVLRTFLLAAGLAVCGTAGAHVTVQPAAAQTGAYQVLRFGVGHGCGDTSATTELRIEIPAGVAIARPQPKPGWTLEIARSGDRIDALVWRGALPPDQYDEFVVLTKLPDAAGPLAFPAIQTCGADQNRWIQIPTPDAPKPSRPAPIVTLTPAAPDAGHSHH